MTDDFCRKIKGKQTGCLLIHGFGGSISEVRSLADFLAAEGYKVECPSLKGHTGNRSDLKQCSYREWIASAKESYDKLAAKCDAIYLIGFSMGGLIAFNLAADNKVEAIVTLNTPIYYWDLKRVALNIADDIRKKKFNNLRRYFDSACKLPTSAMLNFRILLSKTKPMLRKIKCPVFIAQALQDDTVHKRSAGYIYKNIGSELKKVKYYDGSGHLILESKAADSVMKDVTHFLHLYQSSCYTRQ